MPKIVSDSELIKRFETLNPNLHVIGEIGKERCCDISIYCDDCGGIFPRKRYSLLRPVSVGCSICKGNTVVKGINDIATTHPHLVEYFANIKDAYGNSKGSHNIIMIKCPYCGHEQPMQVKNLVNQGFKCHVCDSGISFPNRLARVLLKELPIENWVCEYHPEWSNGKIYDNYFEYQGNKYILEMDGGLGHGNTDFKHHVDMAGLINDNYKDNMAKQHNVDVIRIDCKMSKFEYIKKNILDSKLADIFDLTKIDWNQCYLDSTDNLTVKICDYYRDTKASHKEIMNVFNVGYTTVSKSLKIGGEIGIIDYSPEIAKKKAGKHISEIQKNRVRTVVSLYKGNEYIGRFNNIRQAARKIQELSPEINFSIDGLYNSYYRKSKNGYNGYFIYKE